MYIKYKTKAQELNGTYTLENYQFVDYNPRILNELDRVGVLQDSLFRTNWYFYNAGSTKLTHDTLDTNSIRSEILLSRKRGCDVIGFNQLKLESDTFTIAGYYGSVLILEDHSSQPSKKLMYLNKEMFELNKH